MVSPPSAGEVHDARDRSRSPLRAHSRPQDLGPAPIGLMPSNSEPSDDRPITLGLWIENHYQGCLPKGILPGWLQGVPSRLVDRLKWSPDCSAAQVPTGAIVLPFAGKDDAASLEAILHSQAPGLSSRVLAFDSCRKPDGKDLLDDGLYGALCTAALHGVISFVGACPDFCTWGKDRWFQDSGRFHAERARNPRDAWGIQALPAEALRTADEESLLLLRFLLLSWLAAKASSLAGEPQFRCFLELAEDPARGATSPARKRCSSAWATPALQAWTSDLGLSVLHFDLCSFGFFAPPHQGCHKPSA